jgi:hypothetical protein
MPAKFKENKRERIGRELRKLGRSEDYEVRNSQEENS